MGEVDVVFGIHIFFEIGKGHYYEITTIFTFFLSLGIIFYFFNLLNFYPVTRFLVTLFSNTRLRVFKVNSTDTNSGVDQDVLFGLFNYSPPSCIFLALTSAVVYQTQP